MLLGAGTPEELYRRSQLSEPFLAKLTREPGNARCAFDDYPDGLLPGAHNNLMLMDLLMYHPDDILTKVDRAAMAVSLETRIPMLDRDVVEFAWSLPPSFTRADGEGKLVLKEMLYRYVPKELMERPTKGFSIPVKTWLTQPGLAEWARELLDERKIRREGYFDPAAVSRLWEDFSQRGIWRRQIWFLLQFEEWLEKEKRG